MCQMIERERKSDEYAHMNSQICQIQTCIQSVLLSFTHTTSTHTNTHTNTRRAHTNTHTHTHTHTQEWEGHLGNRSFKVSILISLIGDTCASDYCIFTLLTQCIHTCVCVLYGILSYIILCIRHIQISDACILTQQICKLRVGERKGRVVICVCVAAATGAARRVGTWEEGACDTTVQSVLWYGLVALTCFTCVVLQVGRRTHTISEEFMTPFRNADPRPPSFVHMASG